MKRGILLAVVLVAAACTSSKTPVDTSACPDPADPRVSYVEGSRDNPQRCEVIRFVCVRGSVAFSSECGCGCIRED